MSATTPRIFTIALRLPAHVSDQEAANVLWRVLRAAHRPGIDPAHTYADPISLEVHAATLTEAQDAELRRAMAEQP